MTKTVIKKTKKQLAEEQQPAASSQQPAVSSQQIAASRKQTADSGQDEQEMELLELAIAEIAVNPDNVRRVDENSEAMLELAASIKASGLAVPPIVRETGQGYMLVAGERRITACRMIGLERIKVVNYGPISHEQAVKLMHLENACREDLGRLEEAESVAALVDALGGDRKAAAIELGRSEKWVATRLRLTTDMSPELLAKLKDSGVIDEMPMSYLLEIAKYPADKQDELYDEFNWRYSNNLEEFAEELACFARSLKAARWQLNDSELLPEAGACTDCLKRKGAAPLLFDLDTEADDADECLDCDCFAAKTLAYTAHLIEAEKTKAEKAGTKVVLCSSFGGDWQQRDVAIKRFKPTGDGNRLEKCKKGDPGAVRAVFICGSKSGTAEYMRPIGYDQALQDGNTDELEDAFSRYEKGEKKTLADKREALRRKRWHKVNEIVVEMLRDCDDDERLVKYETLTGDPARVIPAILFVFGMHGQGAENRYSPTVRRVYDTLGDMPDTESAIRSLFDGAIESLIRHLSCCQVSPPNFPDEKIADAQLVCKLFGLNADEIFETTKEMKGLRTPKAWGKEHSDVNERAEQLLVEGRKIELKNPAPLCIKKAMLQESEGV